MCSLERFAWIVTFLHKMKLINNTSPSCATHLLKQSTGVQIIQLISWTNRTCISSKSVEITPFVKRGSQLRQKCWRKHQRKENISQWELIVLRSASCIHGVPIRFHFQMFYLTQERSMDSSLTCAWINKNPHICIVDLITREWSTIKHASMMR